MYNNQAKDTSSTSILKQTTAKMMWCVTILVVVLFSVNSSQARSVRGPRTCVPHPQLPNCYNFCDDKVYYNSQKTEKCELCISCQKGEHPEHPDPCKAQANDELVNCVECPSGEFSEKEDQFHCHPCQVCIGKTVVTECSPTQDRVCGDCLPGFIRVQGDDDFVCIPCKRYYSRSEEDRQKYCQEPTTTTQKPTTSTLETTTAIKTTKYTSTLANNKHVPTTAVRQSQSTSKLSRSSTGYRHHRFTESTIFKIILVVCALIGFGIFMVTCCVVSNIFSKKRPGSKSSSRSSSVSSTAGYTKAKNGEDDVANLHITNAPTNVVSALNTTHHSDKCVPPTSPNLQGKDFSKTYSKKIEVNNSPQAENMERQANPDEVKGASAQSGSASTGTASTGKPSSHQHSPNILSSIRGKLGNKPKTDKKKLPQRRRERSMSVPDICITPNPLDIEETTQENNIRADVDSKPISSDASSGEESDQGLTALPEDAILPLKHQKPRTRKLSIGSSNLAVPPRVRRKSVPSLMPLRSDGGSFSSGSAQEDFALDSQRNTSSANNSRMTSSVHSLRSQPKSPEHKKHRKAFHLSRQLSYENKALETNSENEPLETDLLLHIYRSAESEKEPVVTHPVEADGYYEPAICQGPYEPFYKMYGENSNQPGQSVNQQPVGYPISTVEPVAKCIPTNGPASSAARPAVPPQASSSSNFSATANKLSSPVRSGGHIQRPQTSFSNEGHPPQAVHIYNGLVIHANNSTGVQIAIGDNNNEVQQGTPGAGSTRSDVPQTPEAVECTEPVGYPTSHDPSLI